MNRLIKNAGPRNTGFTLVELIMVLAVLSILVTIGIPSFMHATASNKVTTASNGMLTNLNLAKSNAIKTGKNVILCKSSNGTSCDSSLNWNQGWIIYSDNDGNGDADRDPDSGDNIISVQSAMDSSLNFTFVTGDFVRFTPSGRSNVAGRFCFENSHTASNSRAIVINQAGRFRSEKRSSTNNCAA